MVNSEEPSMEDKVNVLTEAFLRMDLDGKLVKKPFKPLSPNLERGLKADLTEDVEVSLATSKEKIDVANLAIEDLSREEGPLASLTRALIPNALGFQGNQSTKTK